MTVKSLVRGYTRWSKLVYVTNVVLVGGINVAVEIWDLREKAPWLLWLILFSMALIILMFVAEIFEGKWDAAEEQASWESERKLRNRKKERP